MSLHFKSKKDMKTKVFIASKSNNDYLISIVENQYNTVIRNLNKRVCLFSEDNLIEIIVSVNIYENPSKESCADFSLTSSKIVNNEMHLIYEFIGTSC